MKIIVFGGDGFCGWPTSLYLSNKGHDVTIVDNLSRRNIDIELECGSLTPISPMGKRLKAWKEITNNEINFHNFDISIEYDKLLSLINKIKPDAVVHFAEQRAAPYSMKGSHGKRYTVNNNLNATNNILAAIVESTMDIHVVHLGTMGVYGYGDSGMKIPEGYLTVKIKGDRGEYLEKEILYPANPGSIYHLTKTQDALSFGFYNKNDNIRITDLHQGVVWGTDTDETKLDERLINRFDYDGDYGTVLNRFLMQSSISHPLTVHGSGGQTRAFIHIRDTVKCIEIALINPPEIGEKVKIFNQMTETYTVKELAEIISNKMKVEINYIKNPRKEDDTNELYVENKCFINLGLVPIKLEDGLLDEIRDIANKYAKNCDLDKIVCKSYWTEGNKP
jgi:UDP-sulfoquinovose synthase